MVPSCTAAWAQLLITFLNGDHHGFGKYHGFVNHDFSNHDEKLVIWETMIHG
jgi:hypothetical protein